MLNPKSPKVLLVEDDEINAYVMKMTFKAFDMSVVDNGSDAIEFAKEHKDIELFILDINLGDSSWDGYRVLKELRNMEAYNKIPIAALTGYAMQEDIEKGYAAGFDLYLVKPITESEVRPKLLELLNSSKRNGR